MTSKKSDKEVLQKYLRGFGIKFLSYEARKQFEAQYIEAPFTTGLGISYKSKIIFMRDTTPWPDFLHEAGHLIACTKNPYDSQEVNFLGWEYAVVKHLGLDLREWLKRNKDYTVNWFDDGDMNQDYPDLRSIPSEKLSKAYLSIDDIKKPDVQTRFFEYILSKAERDGCVRRGKPWAKRVAKERGWRV